MQGSELEKVDRKIAELEFSIRMKNKTIIEKYAKIVNKLQDGSEGSLSVLSMKDSIKQVEGLLRNES
jgi:hypothetical protein